MSSRRRAHEGSSEEEAEASGGNLNKRRKTSETSEEIEKRLESLICRVGEKSSSSLESNLEGLSVVLEADLPNFKPQILRILVLCSYQLPEKCTIYTTLVGLLNVRNYNCGGEFIEMMVRELKRLISANQYDDARHVVKFIADLVNCHMVTPESLFGLFENLFSVTKEEDVPQSRKDWYAYTILSSLPWVGALLQDQRSSELNQVLSSMHEYITRKRKKLHHSFLRVWSSDEPHPQEEYLECLWAQIVKLSDDNWAEELIPRPYRAFDGILSSSLQHNIPTFSPPPHNDGVSSYPMPKVVFRMFDYTDCPEGPLIPGNHSIERWLIEEYLVQTIKTHRLDKKECATRLLAIPGKDKVPIGHMVIEVLFGELFRLPSPSYPDVFFTSEFIELCKLLPSALPQVLALASEMLFDRLDTMNYSCIDRFVNWFSHHLSNFQFRWSWDEWSDCLQEDPAQPKPKFIKEVLEKCLRLSYHQRICENVPESFGPLLPAEPISYFKYGERIEKPTEMEEAAMTASQRLVACIKQKALESDLQTILEEIPNSPNMTDDESYNPVRLDALLQTLLHLAQKSFSHSCSALAKFHKLLKWAASGENGKIDALRVLHVVWHNHPQMIIVLVDKMVRTQIVDCAAVAKWLFSPDMASDFTRMYVWEVMHSAIRKMDMHVKKVNKELQETVEKAKFTKMTEENDDVNDHLKSYGLFAPSEEDIEKLREKVDSAKAQQKNLFLIIFQRFIMILTDHLVRCRSSGKEFNTPWYKYTIDRLQQVFLMHRGTVQIYMSTLENLLFTADLDQHILDVFQRFASLIR